MRSPAGKPDPLPSLACRAVLLSRGCPRTAGQLLPTLGAGVPPPSPGPPPGAAAMAARGESEMPAPRPPGFRRRAVDLARPRNKPIAQTAGDPGIAGIMPAQPDGPDRRRRGLARELAALAIQMTRPAIAVSVIRAAATSLHTPGTKVIRPVLPAGLRRCRAGLVAFCGQRPCRAGYPRSRAIAAYWQAAAAHTKAWKTSW